MSTDYTIVCRRTPQYKRGQVVIRSTETSERTAVFQHYAEDRRYCYIRYSDETPVRVLTANVMDIHDWRTAREQQASIKDFWK